MLDIERLRAVTAGRFPNDVPTCQVLVVGGGLGGVAAAEDLARQGISVILTEPTSHLGGQLTAQGVSTPDENSDIERDPGPGTRHYRELRAQVRALSAQLPGIKPGRASNVGQCWVSRISAEPDVWERAIRDRLAPLGGPRGIRQVLMRTQLLAVRHYPGNGQVSYADVLKLDTGRITRIGAQYVLDATETGSVLPPAGVPWTIGQEARDAYGEPDAPPEAHPDWVQSFTYSFDVRWTPQGPQPIIDRPPEYEFFRSLGAYTLDYDPAGTGPVRYQVFAKAPGAGGPFWTYRRILAASSFIDNPASPQDVSLINWSGNDFREENFVGKGPDEQVRILRRARAYAQGFLYWLQTECPRDDGSGVGYPEMQPAGDVLGGDGFARAPYIREGRRLLALSTLTENDLMPDSPQLTPDPTPPDRKTGTDFPDAVGTALYAIDIHPARGEPPLLRAALPYSLPLGAFLPQSGPTNLIPAASDWGASRLAMASARMHPTEWEAGEIAGHLAAFCLLHGVMPLQVRETPSLLAAFQAKLEQDGVTIRWGEVAASPSASSPSGASALSSASSPPAPPRRGGGAGGEDPETDAISPMNITDETMPVNSRLTLRPMVLASSRTDARALADIAAGLRPRLDYLAIAQALHADVLDTGAAEQLPGWRRRIERALASDVAQADVAWRRRDGVSAWLSTSEKVGLPLALRGRAGVPHVLIAHNLRSARKRLLHRLTGVLRTGFSAVICLSRSQEAFLRDVVNLPADRIHHVSDNVDTEFWRPGLDGPADGGYLLAVGRENRDYRTLVEAARVLGLPLVIVASSLWSSRALGLDPADVPACVTVRQDFVSYADLRALYAGARLVVVPLGVCDYAAGVNGVLEAMAMGKPSIVTGTEGLAEYVRDGETNRVVPPGDVGAIVDAVRALWDDAPTRQAMGAAGRARAEREMSLDGYAARVAGIVGDVIEKGRRL